MRLGLKIVFLLSLCAFFAISLASCGGGDSASESKSTSTKTTDDNTQKDDDNADDGGGGGGGRNSAPVANAGANRNVVTGLPVTLDGSGSSDADGDLITYSWSFTSKPAGSAAALSSSTAVNPTFTADVDGSFVLSLVVNDGTVDSAADSVTITAATPNSAPVANAGPDQTVTTGYDLIVNGIASSDADGDALTYIWSFISAPPDAYIYFPINLSGFNNHYLYFWTPVDGSYVIKLIVNDGTADSAPDSVTITAITAWHMLGLPDTGQVGNHTATFGEDSDYEINPMSFADNGNGTITDNVTGLMWQKEDDNTQRSDGGWPYCDALSLGGYSDWRLPSDIELMSIINYGSYNPSINSSFFTNTKSSKYCSSTSDVSGNYYHMDFKFGGVCDDFAFWCYARCVRGWREGGTDTKKFVNNGNSTITDINTGLIWQRNDDNTARTREDAIGYCEGLSLAGYNDWRLPNIKEMRSIVDSTQFLTLIDESFFPDTEQYYWSSTSYESNAAFAWSVDFSNGFVQNYANSSLHYARCVRGGM